MLIQFVKEIEQHDDARSERLGHSREEELCIVTMCVLTLSELG